MEELVVNVKTIEARLNNDYNLVLLLTSGKRVYLDLTVDCLRKTVTYQPPSTNNSRYYSEHSQEIITLESHILESTFYSTLQYSSSSFTCSLMRD